MNVVFFLFTPHRTDSKHRSAAHTPASPCRGLPLPLPARYGFNKGSNTNEWPRPPRRQPFFLIATKLLKWLLALETEAPKQSINHLGKPSMTNHTHFFQNHS